MASAWIVTRPTKSGGKRYRVEYKVGGRESRNRYGGSFRTKAEAVQRRQWILGELANLRVPNLRLVAADTPQAPTLVEAAEAWRKSRVDVAEQTGKMHRSDIEASSRSVRTCEVAASTSSPSTMSPPSSRLSRRQSTSGSRSRSHATHSR
jgi:hypothetical protein